MSISDMFSWWNQEDAKEIRSDTEVVDNDIATLVEKPDAKIDRKSFRAAAKRLRLAPDDVAKRIAEARKVKRLDDEIATEPAIREQLHSLRENQKVVDQEADAIIAAEEQRKVEAANAVKSTQSQLAGIIRAKEDRRLLVDTDEAREARAELKQQKSSKLGNQQHLREVIRAAKRDLQNGGVRAALPHPERERRVAEQKAILADAERQLAEIEPELARIDEQLQRAESELIEG